MSLSKTQLSTLTLTANVNVATAATAIVPTSATMNGDKPSPKSENGVVAKEFSDSKKIW